MNWRPTFYCLYLVVAGLQLINVGLAIARGDVALALTAGLVAQLSVQLAIVGSCSERSA